MQQKQLEVGVRTAQVGAGFCAALGLTAVASAVLLCLQEPELLETLYVTQQMAPEAAELALETALRTLSNAVSGNGAASQSDSTVGTAITGLQSASHKYAQVRVVRCLRGVGCPLAKQHPTHQQAAALEPASSSHTRTTWAPT